MHCPSYTPDGHLFTGHHSSTSRGPKIFFCWCKKSQNGARELRALSPRFAQQQWLVGLVCVVQFTIPQRNKHCACHFIGVDEGNKFYLTLLSFNYTLFDSLLVCVALLHHPVSWWRPKIRCPRPVATFRIFWSFFRRALDTNGWNSLQQPCIPVVFWVGVPPTHTKPLDVTVATVFQK